MRTFKATKDGEFLWLETDPQGAFVLSQCELDRFLVVYDMKARAGVLTMIVSDRKLRPPRPESVDAKSICLKVGGILSKEANEQVQEEINRALLELDASV